MYKEEVEELLLWFALVDMWDSRTEPSQGEGGLIDPKGEGPVETIRGRERG